MAYTFDAGPNAVLYLLEPFLAPLLAAVAHYFLPTAVQGEVEAGTGAEACCNRPEALQTAIAAGGPPAAVRAACDGLADLHRPGQVKYMFLTQVGSGPQRVEGEGAEEGGLFELRTGLLKEQGPQSRHKRMRID